jgi:hypothetical protein
VSWSSVTSARELLAAEDEAKEKAAVAAAAK